MAPFLCFFKPALLCFLANRMFRRNLGSTYVHDTSLLGYCSITCHDIVLTPFSDGYRNLLGFLIPFLWFLYAVTERENIVLNRAHQTTYSEPKHHTNSADVSVIEQQKVE